MVSFLQEAAKVRPSRRQLDWFDMEMYAFIHFGVNTFTDREWGEGGEDENLFDPKELDCEQWAKSIRNAGFKGMVLTAKHHDGFCLWPSKYTEHSVKNSPGCPDVVKQASDACRKYGLKFGFYLSPWDRSDKRYGTPEYNDYFCQQLTELLTEYGEIFYVWFDNACGEGENGKKQEYDFPRYFALIRKYQPNAVIFNDFGPDVRWCGNESGSPRVSEWSVVPGELCKYGEVQTGAGPLASQGDLSFLYNTNQTLGDLSQILYSKGLCFVPSEIDMSIRPGWFWHKKEEPHSVQRLFQTYLDSVGSNACLHLNIPPNRQGLLDERDVQRLNEFSQLIKQEFGNPVSCKVQKVETGFPTQPSYEIQLEKPARGVKYIVLEEDLTQGQRIQSFQILADSVSPLFPIYEGTVVGHKKICVLQDPFSQQNPLLGDGTKPVKTFTLRITSARDQVFLKNVTVYC